MGERASRLLERRGSSRAGRMGSRRRPCSEGTSLIVQVSVSSATPSPS